MRAALLALAVAALVVACATRCEAAGSPFHGKATLVILEAMEDQQTYSMFFNSLRARGYKLHFARADASDLALTKFGEYLYDQLVLMAPSASTFGGAVDTRRIIEFIDSGRSVLAVASPSLGDALRELGAECGIEFDDEDTFVVDHLGYDEADGGEHTLIVADSFMGDAEVVLGKGKIAPVLFRGIGHAIVSSDPDGLLLDVLSASRTAYSHQPLVAVTETPLTVGRDTRLVTAVQARNSARIVFAGSLDMFSNKFLSMTVKRAGSSAAPVAAGNAALLDQLTAWAFLERGVLRMAEPHHSKAGETASLGVYRVLDELVFTCKFSEWTGTAWVPYLASDVQLDFQMLDPYVRVTMNATAAGVYTAAFKAPDVYGVFQFKINYRRKGYSAVAYAEQVTVRPFRHNEFERFIVQAYPYYASAFSGMAMFFIFTVVFLHHRSE